MSDVTPRKLYPDAPDAPPELVRALQLILDTFGRLPDPTPERWVILLALIMCNVLNEIQWPSVELRDIRLAELLDNLHVCDRLDGRDTGIAGHG